MNIYYAITASATFVRFYRVAAAVRAEYEDWKQYVAYPMRGLPPSLQSVGGEKEILYCLAAMHKHGVINLDPSKPLWKSMRKYEKIDGWNEPSETDLYELFPLWDSLGRPQIYYCCDFNKIHDSREPFFNKAIEDPRTVFNTSLGHDRSGLTMFSVRSINFASGHRIPLYKPRTRIELDEDHLYTTNICTRPQTKFISYLMAFDSTTSDILSDVKGLFPNISKLIPQIIRHYYSKANSELYREDDDLTKALRNVNREAFGCDISYDKGNGSAPRLYHRGALKQIWESPELFIDWAEDMKMHVVFYELVVPVLRAKFEPGLRLMKTMGLQVIGSANAASWDDSTDNPTGGENAEQELMAKIKGILDTPDSWDNSERVYKRDASEELKDSVFKDEDMFNEGDDLFSQEHSTFLLDPVSARHLINKAFWMDDLAHDLVYTVKLVVLEAVEKYPELVKHFVSCLRSLAIDLSDKDEYKELCESYVFNIIEEARRRPENRIYARHLIKLSQCDPQLAEEVECDFQKAMVRKLDNDQTFRLDSTGSYVLRCR